VEKKEIRFYTEEIGGEGLKKDDIGSKNDKAVSFG